MPYSLALCLALLLSFLTPQRGMSRSLFIETASGDRIELGTEANDKFADVLEQINSFFVAEHQSQISETSPSLPLSLKNPEEISWSLAISPDSLIARAKIDLKREYVALVSKNQKEDIAFILKTLAWSGPIELGKKSSELTAAGDRIERIHPLNFLQVIFSSEELIAAICAIKERKIPTVKSRFFGELKKSLGQEAQVGNLLIFVDDFAEKLKINKKRILPPLENKKYDEFIDVLIELKPRKDADRHNM